MAAEKDPCGGGGAGASRSAVSLDWRATLALGEHLSHPPRLPRKVFFTPPCPSSAPTLSPARVGLGPLVKKVTRSHQLLLPLGTGGGDWRQAPRRTQEDLQPFRRRNWSGASRGSSAAGAPPRAAPISACLRAGQRQHPAALFLPAAPQRASEEGERGSLSAKCCSLVLRGGCSSSNSHSFHRLT